MSITSQGIILKLIYVLILNFFGSNFLLFCKLFYLGKAASVNPANTRAAAASRIGFSLSAESSNYFDQKGMKLVQEAGGVLCEVLVIDY